MADRDTETREAYNTAYDIEHGAQLIDTHGSIINADTIRADLARKTQAAVDAKMQSWFGRTSELGAYDAEAVLQLGHRVI